MKELSSNAGIELPKLIIKNCLIHAKLPSHQFPSCRIKYSSPYRWSVQYAVYFDDPFAQFEQPFSFDDKKVIYTTFWKMLLNFTNTYKSKS